MNVNDALKAREERRKREQQAQASANQAKLDRVNVALDSYKQRKQTESKNAVSDVAKRLQAEIDYAKTLSEPSVGKGTLANTLESTRKNRLNVVNLGKEIESYKNFCDEETYNNLSSAVKELSENYDNRLKVAEIKDKFTNQTEYDNWYKKATRQQELASVSSAEDFAEYSQKGAGVANPSWNDAHAPFKIGGWTPFGDGEDINNMVTFAEANKQQGMTSSAQSMRGGGSASEYSEIVNLINTHMKDEEKAIYNYYIGKEDTARAKEYFDYIIDVLRQRAGGKIAGQIDNTAWETVAAFAAGMEGGFKGIGNFVSGVVGGKEDFDTSALQHAHSEMSENNEGFRKGVNDLAYTTGNMVPSIYAGSVATAIGGPLAGKIVGATVTGLSSAGNSYAQMIERGYGVDQARKYGAMVGSAEAGLSFLIGGISKAGGKLTGNVISKAIDGIDSGIARFFTEFAINSTSEAIEEGAQSILDPIFKMIATGEDFEGIDWSEVGYSAMLGALSAGLLEGVPNAVGGIHENYQTNVEMGGLSNKGAIGAFFKGNENGTKRFKGVAEAYKAGQQNVNEMARAYATEALEIDPENAHAQRMQARLGKGKNVSGTQIDRMVEANENALVSQDKEKMKAAIEQRLTDLGESGANGSVSEIAEVIAKKQAGETLSLVEKSILNGSEYGQRVFDEMSPENIASGEYTSTWAEKIGTDRINAEAYGRMIAKMEAESAPATEAPTAPQAETTPATENEGVKVTAAEGEIGASAVADQKATATMLDGKGNEVSVNPVKFTEIGDGEAMIELEGGQTVRADSVEFKNSGVGFVYQAATEMASGLGGFNVDTANVMVKGVSPDISEEDASLYVAAFNEAYRYGAMGFPSSALETRWSTAFLSEKQRETAHSLGKIYGEGKVAERQAKIDSIVSNNAGKNANKPRKKGRVYFDGSAVGKTLTERQRASLKGLRVVAEALGIDIHIFESELVDNVRQGKNGSYNTATKEIEIDLHAGITGNGIMLNTGSHELTHHIKNLSPAKFKVLADTVIEVYTENGISVERLLANKREFLERKGRLEGLTEEQIDDLVLEEFVADACETMLVDSNALEVLSRRIKSKDKSLWDIIKEFIDKLVARIRAAYEGVEPDSLEGKIMREMKDSAERLQKLWVEALLDTAEAYPAVVEALGKDADIEVNENGEFTVGKAQDGTLLYNDRTYEEGGRETLEKTLREEGFSDDDIRAALVIMDAKHDLVRRLGEEFIAQGEANRATLVTDVKHGHSALSALVKNGDYPVNIDLLTICKKRQAYQRVINHLCESGLIKQATLDSLAIAEINKILGKYGFETACLGCFVESKRLRIQEYANTICKEWNSLVDKKVGKENAKEFGFAKDTFVSDLTDAEIESLTEEYEKAVTKEGNVNVGTGSYLKKFEKLMDSVPSLQKRLSISDIATPKGMSNLKSVSPELFALVASRYGSGTPKPVQSFNPYNSELAIYGSKPKKYASLREYLYAIGGARMQSFSDFIVENWFDYCQIVADLTARKLPMHTYTKEITLAKLFGMTGIKVNMSLIPDIDTSLGKEYAGLTKNAKGEYELIWSDKDRYKATGGKSYMQSINFADAVALQSDPRYSANVGTIAIGISDNHIRVMLDDSRIRMIIPYHKSNINPIFAKLSGIDYYKDYTDVQSTTVKALFDSNGKKADIKLTKKQKEDLTAGFEFNEALQRLGDARAAAQEYIEWCADSSLHTIKIGGEVYTATLTPKFEAFSDHRNYYKLLEDFNTYDSITEQAAPQGDVQQIYPDDFEQILRDELKARENYNKKQEPKWETAMGEIEDYLKKHTKAETKAYAKENNLKLKYSDRVTDTKTLDFLNDQLEKGEVTEVYRAMTVDEEGNLYPPMAGFVRKNGKKVINGQPSVIGEWEQSAESIKWDSVDEAFLTENGFKHFPKPNKDYPNGRFEKDNLIFYINKKGEWKASFKLDKDNGTTVPAAYAPYIHTSLSVLNDQFTSAYKRENLVVVKGYVPNSEIYGENGKTYHAKFADKPTGKTKWHSGVVAAQMPETRTVILSRYFMPIEILDDSEVARKTKEMMKGKDIEIPFNVVTPSQRREMEAIGIRIGEARGLNNPPKKDEVKYSDRVLMGSPFSGGGTLEAGLVYQMLDKEFAVEYNKKIASAYTDNHGKEHMFVGDVRDFNSKEKRNVFYLHASPVCKNFSPASHSGGETPIDITTAQATARVLEEQMPEAFTVENVKRYIGSEAYNIITSKLDELGYTWDVDVYKASDYGNATKRERMVIRAVKDGQLPDKPKKVSKITSWGEATKDLWETDLIPSNLVKSKIEAIRNTPELKNLRLTKLDKPLMIYDTTKSKKVTFAWADDLAPTLTTKCGNARIIMPDGRVYAPTPKFMGRIQGLPDDYKYPEAKTRAFTIIGNGIPTQLTKAVMGGVLDSAYEQTHEGKVLYSDRGNGKKAWLDEAEGIYNSIYSKLIGIDADFKNTIPSFDDFKSFDWEEHKKRWIPGDPDVKMLMAISKISDMSKKEDLYAEAYALADLFKHNKIIVDLRKTSIHQTNEHQTNEQTSRNATEDLDRDYEAMKYLAYMFGDSEVIDEEESSSSKAIDEADRPFGDLDEGGLTFDEWLRYSDRREVQSVTEDEYESLKKHFGVTTSFKVAGYLLPDGKMLDFSGKHLGDTTSRMRQVDHRDVSEVLDRGNNGVSDMVDMIGSGSIRLMPETGGINLAVYPNEKQRRVLSNYINYMLATEGQVVIDYDAVGGDTVHSKEYGKYASSRQILSDIRSYFNGGRQSELMQFHTMYSDRDPDIRYSDRDSYAPTFYSHMGKVIDDIKLEKMGSASILNYLKNRGVKAEEIKWSGIETFLEGKKSVTKEELQAFVAGSQLQIEEENWTGGPNITLEPSLFGGDEWEVMLGGEVLDTYSWSDEYELYVSYNTGDGFKTKERLLEYFKEKYGPGDTRWGRYKLDGGENYREIIFRMPNATHTNPAMRMHWGQDAEGILVHARIQDFVTSDGKQMLFVEEIQSDWHNEGAKDGYLEKSDTERLERLKAKAEEAFFSVEDYSTEMTGSAGEWDTIGKTEKGKQLLGEYREAQGAYDNAMDVLVQKTPDAPFRDNYHEYVMKRLIRMAAEDGYDAIGWTPADIQSKRWSEEYAEAYRIEYDQNIPKFLRKYGKKWGATVGKSTVEGTDVWSMNITDAMKDSVLYEGQVLYSDREIQPITEAETKELEQHFGTTTSFKVAGYLLTDGKLLDFSGKHWGDTTSRMRQVDHRDVGEVLNRGNNGVSDMVDMIGSGNIRLMPETGGINLAVYPNEKQRRVLSTYINYMLATEGQVLIDYDEVGGDTVYSREYGKSASSRQILSDIRGYFNGARQSDLMRFHTDYSDRATDSYSNRSLLAGALETAVQNDIEKQKLEQYKQKIDLINSEEKKLRDLRAQIKTLSFQEGPRDTEALKNLQFEATQTANRINVYDRQLLDLESTKALKGVLAREKKLAYEKAEKRGKEALEKQREREAKTRRELMDRYQQSRQRAAEGRNKTAVRLKIKNVVNSLNSYLLSGSKEKHVPIGLQSAVAEALGAVNMDTVGADKRIAEKEAEMMRAKTPEAIEEIVKEIERIREMGGNLSAKLERLKTAYDDIINSDDPIVANSHDEVISNTISRVIKEIGDTSLRDMNLRQLEAVYDMYKMILTTVRNTNKAFKLKKSEEISTVANQVIAELDEQKKRAHLQSDTAEALSSFDWNNQKPVYAFERIGSETFSDVFTSVREGEDVWAKDMDEAQIFLKEQKKKYNFKDWDFGKKYQFSSTTGLDFSLSLGQIMSLYAFSKRGSQATEHLKYGGFVHDGLTEIKEKGKFGTVKTYKLKDSTAYNLSEGILENIISKLTDEQKHFADAMQDYLSTTMGEKGNEVSLALYDVKLFKEKNYFPLKSAPQFLERAREQANGDVKIKNKGFTKETKPKAKNPIVLSSFMDVWAGHVNEMSMYHAFALPLEDFYRVYNYRTPASETLQSDSVISYLENAHGNASVDYIDQLLRDLNGGARSDSRENIFKKGVSKFKKAAVMASLSVVVQQPSAIVRATALIDAKYFGGKKVSKAKQAETWAEIKKHAPVAIIKEMGYFDTGMGKSSVDWLKGDKTKMDRFDDALSFLPGKADEITWCAIWNAVKRETAAKHTDLATSSEEFLKLAGERFTEVIVKTQVYDSTLAKSANMRSKNLFMNMLTAFMAEPTTSINMLQDAFRKGGKKRIARAMGAVYGSVLLNSVLVSLVYAGRDDDEDETYIEKYLSSLVTEVVDGLNPLTYLPFVKDIWSIAQGFDVERADMTLIDSLIDSFKQLFTVFSKDTDDMDEGERKEHRKSVAEAILSVVDNGASLLGIPEKNLRRDINGAINFVKTLATESGKMSGGSLGDNIVEDLKDSVPIWGWFPDKSKSDKLYDAIVRGDDKYAERLKSGYKEENAINSAIRKALRDNDPRIKEAAELRYKGDIAGYMRVAKEIIAEGNFDQDDVVAAINSAMSAMDKGEDESSASDKAVSLYKVEDYYKAITGGDHASAYAVKYDLIETDIANGKDRDTAEANFNKNLTSHIGDQFEKGSITEYEAKNMLSYAGKTTEEAAEKVQFWNFKKQYPDYDLNESQVTKYYSKVYSSGISVGVYYDYVKKSAGAKGTDSNGDGKADSGTKKREIMYIIHSLPISTYQKDALYRLNGWAESTLYEAPWH